MLKQFKILRPLLLALALTCLPLSSRAEIVVVVNAQLPVEQLTRTQVIHIFLGHNREFPNGQAAQPVDLPANANDKAAFYQALINKDLDQVAAYWSRLVFAGSVAPPVQSGSAADALAMVASRRNAIAYMDRRFVDNRVRIILSLPESR